MLAMYRRAAGQSENPLRPKTYNYFAGELMEQGNAAPTRHFSDWIVRGLARWKARRTYGNARQSTAKRRAQMDGGVTPP